MAAVKLLLPNVGLKEWPQESDIPDNVEELDLSGNLLKVIQTGRMQLMTLLVRLDLSNNQLSGLPADIALCKKLQVLSISHNNIKALPAVLFQLEQLEQLNADSNALTSLEGDWVQLKELKGLNVAYNNIKVVPADIGWLPLTSLALEGNPDLRVPAAVLAQGLRAVMSYLQVICEQHRLVQQHLDKFTAPAAQAEAAQDPSSSGADDREAMAKRRIAAATATGVLDLKECGTQAALAATAKLQAVYVADVRHNAWTSLPKEIVAAPGLVVLNASDNDIVSMAEGVTPEHLGVLNLSFNKLAALPTALGLAPVLQQMYAANNELKDLPESFAELPMVDLFLSENHFERVPRAVLRMTQLAKLSLACCRLKTLPDQLGAVVSLRFLDLSFNQLQDLPSGLSGLTGLNALNVSFNPIPHFPDVIGSLPSLIELNLDYTGISDVLPSLGELHKLEGLQMEGCPLPQPLAELYAANPLLLVQVNNQALTSLDLSGLSLEQFPTQLLRLSGLTALNLARNALATLPSELGQLVSSLKQLNLRDNPLASPFKEVLAAQGDLAVLELLNANAERCDLAGCGFTTLPEVVAAKAATLQQLKLAHNQLAELPPWLSTFTRLTTAVLDNNQLVALPEVLLRLPKLAILMASNNAIKELPTNLGDHTQLQALVLHGNQIAEIPSSVSRLTDLRALSLAHNRLAAVADAVAGCSSLRLLDVSHNEVKELPTGIGALAKLKTLKATNNAIKRVPHGLAGISTLQELHLAHNPFPIQGMDLNAATVSAVRQMLAALLEACKAPSHAAELAVAQAAIADAAAAAAAKAAEAADAAAAKAAEAADAAAATAAAAAAAEADVIVADITALRDEAQRPGTAPPAPPENIITQEDPEKIKRRLEELQRELKHLEPGSKWLFVQKHLETIEKDHLRPKRSDWDNVPIMNIPRIIAAISSPPPPPTDRGFPGRPKRPQVMARFKRVVDQSNVAMQLLGRVQDVMQQQRQAGQGGAGSAGPGTPTGAPPAAPGGGGGGPPTPGGAPMMAFPGGPMAMMAMMAGRPPMPMPGGGFGGPMPPGGGFMPPPGMMMPPGMMPPPGMMMMMPPGMMLPPGMVPPGMMMRPPAGMMFPAGAQPRPPPPPPR